MARKKKIDKIEKIKICQVCGREGAKKFPNVDLLLCSGCKKLVQTEEEALRIARK